MHRRIFIVLATVLLSVLLLSGLWLLWPTQPINAGSMPHICASGCAYSTVQEAVSTADPMITPTLILAGETFTENVVITQSFSLVGMGPTLTIIDGKMTDTVVLVRNGATVSLNGLTLRNGIDDLDGGGLVNDDGIVSVSDVIIEDNQAPDGGGVTNAGQMTLDGVTIRNNAATDLDCDECSGGGIDNIGVMTITNSTISGNTAEYGAGIFNGAVAQLTITNATIENNTAAVDTGMGSAGGGIDNIGEMTITNSAIRSNQAPSGAGIFNEGTVTLTGSDVYDNGTSATSAGGGLLNQFQATIQMSNIYQNQAQNGAGLHNSGVSLLVAQTAVYDNTASGSGGGLYNSIPFGDAMATVINSTFSGNNTAGVGGGVYNGGTAVTELSFVTVNANEAIGGGGIYRANGTLRLNNSIMANTAIGADCGGSITSQGHNLIGDNSCGLSGTADLNGVDPRLGPLQDNGGTTLTHALLGGSLAIDSAANCPATDQTGTPRPIGSNCDRGAYETSATTHYLYLPSVLR